MKRRGITVIAITSRGEKERDRTEVKTDSLRGEKIFDGFYGSPSCRVVY